MYVDATKRFNLCPLLDLSRGPSEAIKRAAAEFDLNDENAWMDFCTQHTTLDLPQARALRSALTEEVF